MRRKIITKIISLLYLIAVAPVFAERPLTIEDLTTDKNRFKLHGNISYFNQTERQIATENYNLIDLGNGRTLLLPNLRDNERNSDTLISTIGLDYGITDRLEIGAKTRVLYNQTRYYSQNNSQKNSDTRLQEIAITGQYQSTKNHPYLPNSLIFSELSLYDNTQSLKTKSFSSLLFGTTVYTINDPVALSATASYQINRNRELQNGQKITIGDVMSLNGSIAFAVNPDITLNTGVSWQLKKGDKINEIKQSKQTQTNLHLGMAYALTARTNLIANVRSNISGNKGSTVSLGFSMKLGKLPPPLSERYRQQTEFVGN